MDESEARSALPLSCGIPRASTKGARARAVVGRPMDQHDEKKKSPDEKVKRQKDRQHVQMYIEVVELCQRKLSAKRRVLISHLQEDIGIHDFECIRMIGRGSFAYVYLVRRKSDDRMYALKAISKDRLTSDEFSSWGMDRDKNTKNLLNELLICRTTTKYHSDAFVNLKSAARSIKV